MANTLKKISIDIDINKARDDQMWDKLIQLIIDGKVIPVIGADLLIDNGDRNLHQLTIDALAKNLKIISSPQSFSELTFDTEYKRHCKENDVYMYVNTIYAHNKFPASERLKTLLNIRQFPFVITTSFTPIVEDVMRDVWKDELKVLKFDNNPSNHRQNDIKNITDLRKPTVYYMFGRVGDGTNYVLRDSDMLAFCASWLSDTKRPNVLCGALKDHYLLMLGNNYSDWLFRFIWYSMRDKDNLNKGMIANKDIDESFINFIERIEAVTRKDPSDVITQIASRLEKKLAAEEDGKFCSPAENMDVFISYSRADKKIAEELYTKLTAEGKRVWFDKNNLSDGGDFMDEIRKAIRTAKYFIPILSNNIIEEKNDPHVYRTEWDVAISVAISMGRTYIIPIAENNFDFYHASIPDKLQQHNAIFYTNSEAIDNVVKRIIHKMNQA
jgi:hypothetical protein